MMILRFTLGSILLFFETISYTIAQEENLLQPIPPPLLPNTDPLIVNRPPEKIYLILASKKIRPGQRYDVSISFVNINEPVQFNILIKKGKENVLRHPGQVNEGAPIKVTFQIPSSFTSGDYQLVFLGMTLSWSYVFYKEAVIEFESKAASIFIQTDKGFYKPGDLVRYRIVLVNSNLKPIKSAVTIYIEDAENNRIKQWANVSGGSYGVISQDFKLSNLAPVLGIWKIVVELLEYRTENVFVVEEYVLPKFEVKVDLPSHVIFSDNVFPVTVNAKYTFGKPVAGRLKILAETERTSTVIFIQFSDIKDGLATVAIPLKDLELQRFIGLDEFDFKITAVVTEALTNATANGTSTVPVYRHKAKVEIIQSSMYFQPGFNYKLQVKVTQSNGLPLPGINNRLNFSYGFDFNSDNMTSEMYSIPLNGLVEIYISVPNSANQLSFKAQYGDVEHRLDIYEKFESPSSTFIKIHCLSENVTIGDNAEFEVMSTSSLSSIDVLIFARGNIITGGHINANDQSSFRFHIKTTIEMMPYARIIVYYIRNDGEIIADGCIFYTEEVLPNKISLSFIQASSRQSESSDIFTVEPKSQVTLHGETSPSSFVACLVVDQSTLLLRTGNDLTKNKIMEELESYDTGRKSGFGPFLPFDDISRKHRDQLINGRNVKEILENSGLTIITNANLISNVENKRPFPGPVFAAGAAEADSAQSFATTTFSPSPPGGPGASNEVPITVRKYFPETWLWFETIASVDGFFNNVSTIPDTITSWIATAFSVDPDLGLGVTVGPEKITVFKPFFVSMNLPYSVIRGETLLLQVLIFSYLPEESQVSVELEANEMFDVSSDYGSKFQSLKRVLQVPSGEPQSIVFPIIPKVAGSILLKVIARSDRAGDAEQKPLLVKPEGVTQHFNVPIFIDLQQSRNFQTSVNVKIPKEGVVPGSEGVEVTVIGDLIGITLRNIENLVRMPYGCGEQNMINFVPNIVILNYLQATKQLTEAILNKILGFLEQGYQRELTFKRFDSSFSAFGNSDSSGSTFLTAFVIKSFAQAKPYILIDSKIIEQAGKWLINQQNLGQFRENGKIIDRELQGNVENGLTLTAYVLIALVESKEDLFRNATLQAQIFLEEHLATETSPFAICIVTYALSLVQSQKADEAFQKLNELAISKDGLIHWGSDNPSSSGPFLQKNVAEVEMTGYALMTHLLRNDVERAAQIAKWLALQRNSFGGFQSTQDTVIGLEAISKFAALIFSPDLNIKVDVSSSQGFSQSFTVDKTNSLVLQSAEIPNTVEVIEVTATGIGSCLAQVSWQYNIGSSFEANSFNLAISVEQNENGLLLKVCTSYKENDPTGMVLMEIALPSGYIADKSSVDIIPPTSAQRIESKNGDTELHIYFNEITLEEVCINLKADRIYIVDKLQEVPVTVFEYYKPEKRITKVYKPEM